MLWENEDGSLEQWTVPEGTMAGMNKSVAELEEVWHKVNVLSESNAHYWASVETDDGRSED